METIKQELENLLSIQKQLKSEKLEQIDFDKLIVQIDKVQILYVTHEKQHAEYHILKENLIQKISTMEKAMHVVSHKRPNIKEVEKSLQQLSQFGSEKLIDLFESTELKFHTAFPSTFQNNFHKKKRAKEYSSCK